MEFIETLKQKYKIDLNKQQQEAVLNINGPVLLLAVPGGGKTTVIVSRCANMVLNHKINPDSILTLTFSKASAMDMKNRFNHIFGGEVSQEVHFSTIHSFCYSVLRTFSNRFGASFPTIIEGNGSAVARAQLLKQIYLKLNCEYINEDKLDELSNTICYVKNMMLTSEEIGQFKAGIKNFPEIFKTYEDFKQKNNYIDYDDMLTRTLELFNKNEKLLRIYRQKFMYINVDESQDTSYIQHQIIKLLANPVNNIFMVGDEDQSIYTFRAAFPKALIDFKDTYPDARVLLMERNYRSTKCIVEAANRFIKQNNERYEKSMYSENCEGDSIKYTRLPDRDAQYKHIADFLDRVENLKGTAVLYRNNISVIPLADVLERRNIPFYVREHKSTFFNHWVTTDIVSFMSLAMDANDIQAFKQVYYKMNAYLSKAIFEYVENNPGTARNLFDVLLTAPDINKNVENRIKEIKQGLGKIPRMRPVKAIEYIEEVLGYGDYLKRRDKDGGYTAEGLTQIINSLKSIATHTNTVKDFLNRLQELFPIMENAKFNKGRNAVTLSTIHSSKGLEFEKVFIIDLYDGQFPSSASISDYEADDNRLMEEEVRLFYVGATRAKQYLELITSRTVDGKQVKPSRFMEQLLTPASTEPTVIIPGKEQPGVDLSKYRIIPITSEKNLSIGKQVAHRKYGIGHIGFINESKDLLEIHFINSGLRTFSLKTCIRGGLIFILEDELAHNIEDKAENGTDSNFIKNIDMKQLRDFVLDIGRKGSNKEMLPVFFRHPDYEVRRRACSAAGKLKDKDITEHIVPCLYDKEPQVRQYALRAVLRSKCTQVMEHVREMMKTEDKDYNLKLCRSILK